MGSFKNGNVITGTIALFFDGVLYSDSLKVVFSRL